MEARRKRNIKSGEEYDHLFPKAEGDTSTIRKNANVAHTVAFIPKVVNETLDQSKRITQLLKGKTTYETCSNIWHFVYQHIAYRKDQEGYEQIRSPARAWHDRRKGVDCDCYSVFISSILTNVHVPHILRITKYHRDYFQHIYPVVLSGGKEIVMDCVTDQFNYEVPYSEKKDYPMDLQYLSGFEDDSIGELGKVLAKKMAAKKGAMPLKKITTKKKASLLTKAKDKAAAKQAKTPSAAKPKKKGIIKKVLNKVNKINPATVLLRNGILASMKLNVKNVAKRLRWSYLSPEEAVKRGIDPAKFQRLVATRQKLENIFYGAGGKVDNLKKAILGGKGNKDKAVHGLDGFSFAGIEFTSAYTPLPQLLGPEVYYSENVEGFEGLGQLGEPVTLASVGAAMGVIAGIVAALKQIGDIFPKKTKGSEDFDEKVNAAAENNQPVPDTTPVPNEVEKTSATTTQVNNSTSEDAFVSNSSNSSTENALVKTESGSYNTNSTTPTESDNTPVVSKQENAIVQQTNTTTDTTNTNDGTTPPVKESFWDKNKSWLKPVAIGVGGISLIAIGFAVLKPKHTTNKSPSSSLSGVPGSKRTKRNHHRKHKSNKSKPSKKTAVALL
jgi:hypothetical protein